MSTRTLLIHHGDVECATVAELRAGWFAGQPFHWVNQYQLISVAGVNGLHPLTLRAITPQQTIIETIIKALDTE